MNLSPLLNLIGTAPLEWTIEEHAKGLKYCIGCTDKDGTVHLIQVMSYEKGMIFENTLPPDRIPKLSISNFISEYVKIRNFHGDKNRDNKKLYRLKEKYSVCSAGTILKLMKKSRYKDQQISF